MTKETNLSIATRIVASTPDKALALSEIMNVLGVSRSNAFVYHTKASKALNGAGSTDKPVKAEKAEKAVSKTSVSMTSATKKAAKLAEIDAFLANNKSAAGNPFAALGA
jgi:hypothetical protein